MSRHRLQSRPIRSWGTYCAPTALARLFGITYEAAARRIQRHGGQHHSVTADVMRRLLQPHGITQEQFFKRRPLFRQWRDNRPGYWVLIVQGYRGSGHCVALKHGAALDNGWIMLGGERRLYKLRIYAAWQIEKL